MLWPFSFELPEGEDDSCCELTSGRKAAFPGQRSAHECWDDADALDEHSEPVTGDLVAYHLLQHVASSDERVTLLGQAALSVCRQPGQPSPAMEVVSPLTVVDWCAVQRRKEELIVIHVLTIRRRSTS